ncbi:MAG: GIY-YIG nuclease family protein [Nitrospiria bacterium]
MRPRLESHFLKKDFWNRGVFFVTTQSGALNKAHVQYLEARLIGLAQAAKRVSLENKNAKTLPTLNPADQAEMEVFLEHVLQILSLLGITAFETPSAKKVLRNNRLFIEAKGLKAEGYESTEGFVVCAGSQAAMDLVPSIPKSIEALRGKLSASGVLEINNGYYRVTQDYSFGSPSTAAPVILGRSANGRIEWKDTSGRTLKAIQNTLANIGGSFEKHK